MTLVHWLLLTLGLVEILIAASCLVLISVRLGRMRGVGWGVVGLLGYAFVWGWRNGKANKFLPVMWTWTVAGALWVITCSALAVSLYFQKREHPTAAQQHSTRRADALDYLQRGKTREETGQFETAIQYYREAARLEPANTVVLNTLALAYEKAGRYSDAESTYRSVIEASAQPERETYDSVARVLRAQGYTAAAEDYEKLAAAKRLDPSIPAAQRAMCGSAADWRNPRVYRAVGDSREDDRWRRPVGRTRRPR